jgi:hypothetical protein
MPHPPGPRRSLPRCLQSSYPHPARTNGRRVPASPPPAPCPVQRALIQSMRDAGTKAGNIDRMQARAGQSASLASQRPAADLARDLWERARAMLG